MHEKDILNHDLHNYIKFDEGPHEYWYFPSGDKRRTTDRIQFNGVTSWIKQFEQHKDWKGIAFGSSKNPSSEWYGMDVEDILAAWKQKGVDSAEDGNAIHKAIEDSVEHGLYDEDMSVYIDAFWETMDAHDIKPIGAEVVVYDKDIGRASPIDIVGLRDSQVIIVDTKTFADGMTWEGYNGETFQHPLGHIQTSKYNKTCLQTSVYRYWLENIYGIDVGDTYCFLINDDGYDLIPTLYLEDEVKKMYEYSDHETPWN